MLKIDPKFIEQVNEASSYQELLPLVQKAVELEHSTIPPYLTALYSLKPNANREIRNIIHSIVIEEMLHMAISSNIMNALGGSPVIYAKEFVPDYPTQLPMGIGESLIVGLERYSVALVENVFMKIEEPETPIIFKSALESLETFRTIGEFYQALQRKITELPGNTLPGDSSKQVTSNFFSASHLFSIRTTEDAIKAIDVIVRQGEGTTVSPFDDEKNLAHYYEFEQLFNGRKLIADPTAPNGYSFSGDAIGFDESGVFPLLPNTKTAMLPEGTEERNRLDEFNAAYTQLLNALHKTFNGSPKYLDNTIGLMYDIKLSGEKLCATAFPGKPSYNIAPSFEFVDLD